MGTVRRYVVLSPAGITLRGRDIPAAGELVYEPWLDGLAGRMVQLAVIAPAGEVDEVDVPT